MIKTIALVVGVLLFLLWERLRPFFSYAPGHKRVHWVGNLMISVLDAALTRVAFSGMTVWALSSEIWQGVGLLRLAPLPSPIAFVVGFLLLDLWTYFWHRVNHQWSFLWRFHKAHHSDTEMDATTALRFHPIELALSTLLRVPLYILLGIDSGTLLWYETVLVVSTLFQHANIALPGKWDDRLRWVLVTPVMHKLHHSVLRLECNSNYSSIFSWWDRLFGTWTTTKDPGAIVLGLHDHRDRSWQSLWGILKTPFSRH